MPVGKIHPFHGAPDSPKPPLVFHLISPLAFSMELGGFLVNRLYYHQFVWYFPAIWGCGWHDRTAKMLFCSFVLFWVCLSEQESSLLGFLLFSWSCHLWLNSYPLLMLPKKKKIKNLLLIDLIGIFYQFHHVPSHVPRLCPHAESSRNVPVVHLPQQCLRKVNRSWTQLHQTCVADRPGPVYLSRKVSAVWRGFLCCFSWQHSRNQAVLQEWETVQCMSFTEVLRESNKPKAFRRLLSKLSQNEHIQVQSICVKDKLGISLGPAAKKKEAYSNKMQWISVCIDSTKYSSQELLNSNIKSRSTSAVQLSSFFFSKSESVTILTDINGNGDTSDAGRSSFAQL